VLSNLSLKYTIWIVAAWAVTIFLFVSCASRQHNGLNMELVEQGNDTCRPHEHDIVQVALNFGLKDTLLFDSRSLDVPMEFPLLKPVFQGDLYQGLRQLGKGDSAIITVVADSFFIKSAGFPQLPSFVEPGELLTYHLRLVDFMSREAYDSLLDIRTIEQQRDEKQKIIQYLIENELDTTSTSSGLILIPEIIGKGRLPDTGDMCQVYFEVRILGGDTLFSNFKSDPFDVEYGKEFDNVGFMEGLGLLTEGNTARFVVPSWIGVGANGYDGVPGFTTLDYTVHFVQIRPLEVVQAERIRKKELKKQMLAQNKKDEPDKIARYIKENQIVADTTATGLYIIPLTKGQGKAPQKTGSTVTINYTQYALDGSVIVSSYTNNKPFVFETGRGEVIKGWEEALSQMVEGDKVHLIVPSKLGYGSRVRGEKNPPYSPLIFDLELIKVE